MYRERVRAYACVRVRRECASACIGARVRAWVRDCVLTFVSASARRLYPPRRSRAASVSLSARFTALAISSQTWLYCSCSVASLSGRDAEE